MSSDCTGEKVGDDEAAAAAVGEGPASASAVKAGLVSSVEMVSLVPSASPSADHQTL